MNKTCTRCKYTLSIDMFSPNKSRKDGFQHYCIECMKEYRREHYRNNKQQYYDRKNKTDKILRQYRNDIKLNAICASCGIDYPNEPYLFEFDHLSSSEKSKCVSHLVGNGSLKKLKEEISKCQILCLICHRRKTAKDLNWYEGV